VKTKKGPQEQPWEPFGSQKPRWNYSIRWRTVSRRRSLDTMLLQQQMQAVRPMLLKAMLSITWTYSRVSPEVLSRSWSTLRRSFNEANFPLISFCFFVFRDSYHRGLLWFPTAWSRTTWIQKGWKMNPVSAFG